jgi:hypothetical protein
MGVGTPRHVKIWSESAPFMAANERDGRHGDGGARRWRRVLTVVKGTPSSVCDAARLALDRLTLDIGPGGERTVLEPSGLHMPLRVRRFNDSAHGSLFSVGHYHESTVGTVRALVGDPEVVLLRVQSGVWIPLSLRTPFANVAMAETSGFPRPRLSSEHARLVKLVEVWMRNVEANLLRGNVLEEQINRAASYAAE